MHQKLTHGDRCPACGKGNVYGQKEPKVLVRIVGQAPLAATVYSLERLRCGACGQVFTAEEPEGVGPEKYDETAAAMIAQLKYGSASTECSLRSGLCGGQSCHLRAGPAASPNSANHSRASSPPIHSAQN